MDGGKHLAWSSTLSLLNHMRKGAFNTYTGIVRVFLLLRHYILGKTIPARFWVWLTEHARLVLGRKVYRTAYPTR